MARVAVIGGGISGLMAARNLANHHQVTLYEADQRLGGHSDTHYVAEADAEIAIDSGFIVFNRGHYPYFNAMLDDLNVPSIESDMSFSVHDESTGFEYSAQSGLSGLVARKRNLLSPAFYRMVADILRFYRQAGVALKQLDDALTLGQFLHQHGYSRSFSEWHLLPMACALWSASLDRIMDYPMRYLLQFMDNHCMLQLRQRPPWRTISGGSKQYVTALRHHIQAEFRIGDPVLSVCRGQHNVWVKSAGAEREYDALVMACHSDQALRLLADADVTEHDVVGAIRYQRNEAVLHYDTQLLPRRRKAWASWNARVGGDARQTCTVSYYMNRLQKLQAKRHYIVSLNQTDVIDENKIVARRVYHHPVYAPATIAAQQRRNEINGPRRTWYAGAYWGWGFHEDGARSGVEVASQINEYFS